MLTFFHNNFIPVGLFCFSIFSKVNELRVHVFPSLNYYLLSRQYQRIDKKYQYKIKKKQRLTKYTTAETKTLVH